MKNSVKLAMACSLAALAATSQAALKTKIKSNNCNDRSATCSEPAAESETISLIWNGEEMTGVHAIGATATAMSGESFSWGVSNPSSMSYDGMASGKTGHVTLNRRTVTSGPGSISVEFDGQSSGACPVSYDAFSPIKGVGVVIKKNPGSSSERYALSGVTVTRCDASGITMTYSSVTTYDLASSKK